MRIVGRDRVVVALAVILATSVSGCASVLLGPDAVRRQVIVQTGQPPVSELEVDIGRITMAIVRASLPEGATLPLAGLKRLEVATYGLAGAPVPPLDLAPLPTTGWDPVVKQRDANHSVLVLVRPLDREKPIRDLVFVASGSRNVLYARLAGTLSRDLPDALGRAAASGDTETVRRALVDPARGIR